MEKLRLAIKKYYKAHQVSKSINIIGLSLMDVPSTSIKPMKCVCNFLQPKTGWNKKVTATSSPEEQCFHCMNQLKEQFSDYTCDTRKILPPGPDNIQCKYCYWYCAKKYVSPNSRLQLTKKFIKKGNMK